MERWPHLPLLTFISLGREHCAVRIEDAHVSRKHVMVSFEDGHWQIRDQNSGNGVFVNGRRVETAAVDQTLTIHLGNNGQILVMDVESRPVPPNRRSRSRNQPAKRSSGELRRTLLWSGGGRRIGRWADDDDHARRRRSEETAASLPWRGGVVSLAAVAAGGYVITATNNWRGSRLLRKRSSTP